MKRRLLETFLVGGAAALVAILIWSSGILDRLEYATWAWRVQLFARPSPATDKIKLILLDQASLDWGQKENGLSWPWPRQVYSPIVDFCKRSGARAVIFDVLYTEPSVYGVSDDENLGEAIGRSPGFVAPLYLHTGGGEAADFPAKIGERAFYDIKNLKEWMAGRAGTSIAASKATLPIDEVALNATFLANITDAPDIDGVFRRAHLFHVYGEKAIPSLGLAAFNSGFEKERNRSGARIEGDCLIAGGRRIPMDSEGRTILRFRGPSGTFESFSAASIIQSELRLKAGQGNAAVSPDTFKDCYVFFGFSAPGLLDLRPTPVSRISPGVEVHATVLDNLLSNDFLREPPIAAVVITTILFALLGSFPVVVLSKNVWHTVAAFALISPVPAAIGFLLYALGFWWPIVVQESAVVLSLVSAVIVNYATEGRQRAFIKKAFKHYLSPAVIERILEDPSKLKLGGERRELTILFSDLEGFSTLSEKLDPPSLTCLLNDYLSDMTDIILEEGGTLDKYEGDAIIAFWNAPSTQPDHAQRACRAALRCQRKLGERRAEFKERTGALLRARIGINTGEVIVGNMGSRTRFDYTVLGDAANLASRLEGANKAFGTFTMVSEQTWLKTSGAFQGRELGQLRVVGRKTPVRVFEPIGFAMENQGGAVNEFELGLGFCYEMRWQEALEVFEKLESDPAAKKYAGLCRNMLENPQAAWSGVWNLTEK